MKIVGLTGGIGSGKSTVAQMFENFGVPVYNSDERAKELMVTSRVARKQVIGLFGDEAYSGEELNRSFIAAKVFKDRELLTKLNKIVHPMVRQDFLSWAKEQDYPYIIQEAAIIFENGNQDFYDEIILVTAPQEVRLARIMERDGFSRKKVLERMENQFPDFKKIPFSDYVINNENLDETLSKVEMLHGRLLDNSG